MCMGCHAVKALQPSILTALHPAARLPTSLARIRPATGAYLRSVAKIQQGQGRQRAQPEQVEVRDAAARKPQRRQPRQMLPEDVRLPQQQQASS